MIETFANNRGLAEVAARAVVGQLAEGLQTRSRAALVATGGRAAGPVYDRLKDDGRIDWTRVVVTLSDERCVPPDSPDSNARLVRERLLLGEAGKAHLAPLWPKPPEAMLQALAPFDAVMLGMGEDGHIASLLPGDPALARHLDLQGQEWLIDAPAGLGSPPTPRVSLTLRALVAAHAIFLLIAGDVKREVVERALAGEDFPVKALLLQRKAPVRILWSPAYGR